MASKSTVVMKKAGNRGGVNPGTGGANIGRLPYGAITGGQNAADPVKVVAESQKSQRRAIGYGEH